MSVKKAAAYLLLICRSFFPVTQILCCTFHSFLFFIHFYFSFISVFHHFYFLSFLPAIVLRHQSFLLLHNHHIIDHNISRRSYPRGLVSKAGCQITESRNRKQ